MTSLPEAPPYLQGDTRAKWIRISAKVYRSGLCSWAGTKGLKKLPKLNSVMPRKVTTKAKTTRTSAPGRGYDKSWVWLRRQFLIQEPECRVCAARETSRQAKEVDHIRPLRDGGRHHIKNLQSLCGNCHKEKTKSDVRLRASRE